MSCLVILLVTCSHASRPDSNPRPVITDYTPRKDYPERFPNFNSVDTTSSRFDARNHTTYRPTNDLCIMRDMQSENFCSVCVEGLWLRLLGLPVSFLDNITQVTQQDGTTLVELDLLPLAEFRQVPTSHREAFSISWYDESTAGLLSEWANSTTARLPTGVTEFTVEIRFWTEQVRVDTDGVLVQKFSFTIKSDMHLQSSSAGWQNHLYRL